MSDITLEWFFQIPGLFITIGVLLILVALLVLIIGGSRARNKSAKEEDNTSVDEVVQPVAKQEETVNVVEDNVSNTLDNNINVLSTVNTVNTIDNVDTNPVNNLNSVVEPVSVNNSDNIMSVDVAAPSIVTPVSINDNVEVKNTETIEEMEGSNIVSEPIIKTNEENLDNNVNQFTSQNESDSIVSDSLESPAIFEQPIAFRNPVVENNVSDSLNSTVAPIFSGEENNQLNEGNLVELTPIEPILKNANHDINTVNVVEPIIEPVAPAEPVVPNNTNVVNDSIIVPVVENTTSTAMPGENTEIEEIL